MRIDLVNNAKNRRKKRRASRAFHSAIALPDVPSQREQKGRQRAQSADARAIERRARARRQETGASAEGQTRRSVVRAIVRRLPALVLLAVLVGGIVYTSVDARFFVYEAEIHGALHIAPETVYESARVHQQNIFWIDPQEVARRVVALEGIKVVRVACELPGRVSIEVEERQPAILWRTESQGKDWWLDAEGRVLPYHGDAASPDTVFVVDASERDLDVGQTVEPLGIARSVMQLAEALPDAQLFYYQADRGLSFTQQSATGSWPVYVGSGEDLPRKIHVMLALSSYLEASNIRPLYIDVRWADHPVYGRPGVESGGSE